jgi:molecular chaperone GrpE (heat shock protein)
MSVVADGDATFATRNPLRDTQPSRATAKSRTNLSNAEKATYSEQHQVKKDANQALAADIENFMVKREEEIQDLAKTHSRKPEYIRDLLDHTSHYKKARPPTLQNALAHHKAIEVNEGVYIFSIQAVIHCPSSR